MNSKPLAITLRVVSLAALAQLCVALPEDNQQPINIQADRATQYSSETGEKTEYFGNVVMTQGSLKVNADHVILHSTDRKVTHIIASGEPAKLQQQSDPDKAPVKARAHNIDYRLSTETVTLTQNAQLEQSDAIFSGNYLKYNVATEEVIARERVNMVFTPAQKSDDTDHDPEQNKPRESHGDAESQ